MHEQHALIFTLGNLGSMTNRRWLARGLQMIKLDETRFPNGKVWKEHWNSSRFGTDKHRAFVLHSNWASTRSGKKLRLKRDNLWFLDDDDQKCRPGFDPFAEGCHRRCVSVRECGVGKPCEEHTCGSLTKDARLEAQRSAMRSGKAIADGDVERCWHPMAWRRACVKASKAQGTSRPRTEGLAGPIRIR